MTSAPSLTVVKGEPRPRWRVECVPPHQEGKRRYPSYWQAVVSAPLPVGVDPECGHRHPSPYRAHVCGGLLWGAEQEQREEAS